MVAKSLGAVICVNLNEGIFDTIKERMTSPVFGNERRQAVFNIMNKAKNEAKKKAMMNQTKK